MIVPSTVSSLLTVRFMSNLMQALSSSATTANAPIRASALRERVIGTSLSYTVGRRDAELGQLAGSRTLPDGLGSNRRTRKRVDDLLDEVRQERVERVRRHRRLVALEVARHGLL